MAIKVNGTTVIDDSRNLVNIASGAGSSTTFGDVGTYTTGRPMNTTNYGLGATASSFHALGTDTESRSAYFYGSPPNFYGYAHTQAMSGTWRSMDGAYGDGNITGIPGLWVRIS
jgi:hypothetical protein